MLSALLESGAPGVWTCQAATAEEAGEGRPAAATAAAAAVTAAAAEEAAAAADALSEVVKPWLFSPQWRCRAAATRSLVTLRQAAHDWASFVNEEAGGISRPFLWPASSSTGVVIGLLVDASTDEHAPVRHEAVLGLGAVFAMTRTWEVRAASVVRLPSSPLSLLFLSPPPTPPTTTAIRIPIIIPTTPNVGGWVVCALCVCVWCVVCLFVVVAMFNTTTTNYFYYYFYFYSYYFSVSSLHHPLSLPQPQPLHCPSRLSFPLPS